MTRHSERRATVGAVGDPAREITMYRAVGVVFEDQRSGVGIELRESEAGPLFRLDLTTPAEAREFLDALERTIRAAWPELLPGTRSTH